MNRRAEFDEELIRKYLLLTNLEEFKIRRLFGVLIFKNNPNAISKNDNNCDVSRRYFNFSLKKSMVRFQASSAAALS